MLRSCLLSLLVALAPAVALAEDPAPDAAPAEAEAPPPAPVTYAVNPAKGLTYIRVYKDPDTLGAGLSHNHVIRAAGHSGSFTWNAADPGACRLEVTLPVAQLDVDDPGLRKKLGIEGELSDGQRGDVKKNMLAKEQLDGATHANISFKSRGCSGDGANFQVQGDLSIRGKSKPVVLKGKLVADGSSFAISGKLPLKATDFGFEPFSAMFGQLKNLDAMDLTVDLQGDAR